MSAQSAKIDRVASADGAPRPRTRRSTDSPRGPGSGLDDDGSGCQGTVGVCQVTPARDGPASTVTTASGSAPGGRPPAAVSRVWPGGRLLEQRPAATRVELGEHVVEQQHRGGAGRLGDDLVGGQPQGQRQRPLLALRGVGAGRQPADGQVEVVAVGPDQAHPATQLVAPGVGQRRRQPLLAPGRAVGRR